MAKQVTLSLELLLNILVLSLLLYYIWLCFMFIIKLQGFFIKYIIVLEKPLTNYKINLFNFSLYLMQFLNFFLLILYIFNTSFQMFDTLFSAVSPLRRAMISRAVNKLLIVKQQNLLAAAVQSCRCILV